MFTINIYLRFALIAAGFLLGAGLWFAYGFWYGFPFLLTGIILLAGYIMFGTVMSSFKMIQDGNFDGAEKQLGLTYMPKWLLFLVRSQYFMAKSTIQMQRKDFTGAEEYTKQALAIGFSSDNEKAIALMQLAGIAANKMNRNMALKYMDDIKKLNITEPMIKDQIKEIDKNLKQAQQGMSPNQAFMMQAGKGGFRMGGSKKPRPKVR